VKAFDRLGVDGLMLSPTAGDLDQVDLLAELVLRTAP
jgi:hypothetical protein